MKKYQRTMLPFALLLGGVLIAVILFKFQPQASKAATGVKLPTVRIVEAIAAPGTSEIRTTGVVGPSQQITVLPEVTGKILFRSDNLVPGGRVSKDDVLLRIDPRQYSLSIKQQQSQVQQANLNLRLEESRHKIARREWKILGDNSTDEDKDLALRKPQLKTSQESLKAAKSSLEQAKLNLSKTVIRAPFSAMVVSENSDVGQVVGPGQVVATLIGTNRFWINATVPVEQLPWIKVPGFNSEESSVVQIEQRFPDAPNIVREGRVLGLAGGLDPKTRTAQLLIGLDAPLDPPDGEMPLLNGAFVYLDILGRERESTINLPRTAIVQGNKVWVVGKDDRLMQKEVTIGWGDDESVTLTAGLETGERVVTTQLSLPVNGMQVKIDVAPVAAEEKAIKPTQESQS